MSTDPNKKIKIVFTCLDWRLHPQVENYFTQNGDGCEMCVTAGSIKALIDPVTQKYFLEQIDISKKLHNCQAVVLTAHIDCGAYGGSTAFENRQQEIERYKNEIEKAKKIINAKFPDLPIESYIVGLEHLDGEWKIDPQPM